QLRFQRALTLARLGDHARATAKVNRLIEIRNIPAPLVYQGACVYALASAAVKEPKLRESHAVRAMELLRRASGGFDVDDLKNDSDLKPVRGRADFQKLLRELGEGRKPR